MSDNALRYPIGHYVAPETISPEQRERWLQELSELPFLVRAMTKQLTPAHLEMRYRPEGWKGAQVVHHLVDSHINSYMRFRLALTEDHPTIRPYDEVAWANLPDAGDPDIEDALDLLDCLHKRLVKMLRSMKEEDWSRTFYHPESKESVRLDWNLGMYAWHGRHHLAHLQLLGDSPCC